MSEKIKNHRKKFESSLLEADTVQKLTELRNLTVQDLKRIELDIAIPPEKHWVPADGYKDWRKRASFARAAKQGELAEINARLKNANRKWNTDQPVELSTPEGMLHACLVFIHKVSCEFDLSEEEFQEKNRIRDAVNLYLSTKVKLA